MSAHSIIILPFRFRFSSTTTNEPKCGDVCLVDVFSYEFRTIVVITEETDNYVKQKLRRGCEEVYTFRSCTNI